MGLDGRWLSSGGFPFQMGALAALFDVMDLLVIKVDPRLGGSPLPANVTVVPLPQLKGSGLRRKLSLVANLPSYIFPILDHLVEADVVHTPVPGDIPLVAMVMGLMLRKHMIVRYGGSWETTSQTTMMNRLTRLLMRMFAGGRNVVFAAGAKDIAPARRISWIFSTALARCELERTNPNVNPGMSQPAQLAYLGRLSPEKGVDVLIRAMGVLKRELERRTPILAIAGDGPERPKLEQLVTQVNCETSISFLGQLTRSQLSDLFIRTDICVQPSLTEGFSKAWLDAMSHGVPVVSSCVGAAAEVVGRHGERGWLVPPGDVQALASTLKHIITNQQDWIPLRRRCREFVESRTLETWGKTILTTCAIQWGWSVENGKLERRAFRSDYGNTHVRP